MSEDDREPTTAEMAALTICVLAVCATVVALGYLVVRAVGGC